MPVILTLRKAATGFALVAAVAACSPVPRSTIAAFHDFDLSTVAAADLRIAVRTPDSFRIDGDAPGLTVTVVIDGGAPETRLFAMTEVPLPASLAGERRSDAAVRAYALDARSAADLDAYLADVRARSAPGLRQVMVGMSLDGCRTDGRSDGLPVTTFVQLEPTEPFLLLTRERDIADLARFAGVTAAVAAC